MIGFGYHLDTGIMDIQNLFYYGDVDIMLNSINAAFLENTGTTDGQVDMKLVGDVSDHGLAGHTTSPTFVDWEKDGKLDLLLGAENGHLYYLKNDR